MEFTDDFMADYQSQGMYQSQYGKGHTEKSKSHFSENESVKFSDYNSSI